MLEVERKYMLSNSNQTYSYPRIANQQPIHKDFSSDDDDDDASVDGVTVYNLNEQNLRNYEKERLSFEISATKGRDSHRIEKQQEIFLQQQLMQQQLGQYQKNMNQANSQQVSVIPQHQQDQHPQGSLHIQAADNHNSNIVQLNKFEQHCLNPSNALLNPCLQDLAQQKQNLEQIQKPSLNYQQYPNSSNQQANENVNSQNSITKLQFQQFPLANKANLIFCESPKIKMHMHTSSDILPNGIRDNQNQDNNHKNNHNHNAYQINNSSKSHNMSKSINTYGSNNQNYIHNQPPVGQVVQRSQQLTQILKQQVLSEDQGRDGKKTQDGNQQGQEKKQKQLLQNQQQHSVQTRQLSENTSRVVQNMNSKKKMEQTQQQQQYQFHMKRNSSTRCDTKSLSSRIPTEDDGHKYSSRQNQQYQQQQQQHLRNNGLALSVNINLNLAVAKKTHIQQYNNHLATGDGQVMSSAEDRLAGIRKTGQNNKLSNNNNTQISHKNISNNNNTTATRSTTTDTNSRRMKTEGNEYGMAEQLIQKSQLKTQNSNGCTRTFSEPAEHIFDDGQQLEDTIENFEQALQDGQDSEEGEIAVLEGYQSILNGKSITGDKQNSGLNVKGMSNNKSSNSSKRIKKDNQLNRMSAEITHLDQQKEQNILGQQQEQLGQFKQILDSSKKQQQQQMSQPTVQGGKNLNPTFQSLAASRIPTDPDRNIIKQNSRFQTEISCPVQSIIPQCEIINNPNQSNSSSRVQSKNKVPNYESTALPSQSISNQLDLNGFLQQQQRVTAAVNNNNIIPNLHQLKNSLLGHLPSYKQITNKTGQYHSKASSQQYDPTTNHQGTAGLINKKQKDDQIYEKSATKQIQNDESLQRLLISAANSIQSKGIIGQFEQPSQGKTKQKLDIQQDNSKKTLKTLENDFNPQSNSEKIPQFNNNLHTLQQSIISINRQPKLRTASSFHHLSSHKTESGVTPKKLNTPFQLNNFTFMQPQNCMQMSAEFVGNNPTQNQQQPTPYSIGAAGNSAISGQIINEQVNNNNTHVGQSSLSSSQGINSGSKRNLLYNNSSNSHLIGNALRHHNAPQFASIRLSQTKLPSQLNSEIKDSIMSAALQKQDQQELQLQKQPNLKYSSNELPHQDYQLLNTQDNLNKVHNQPFAPSVSAVTLNLKKHTSNHKDSSHSHSARRTNTLLAKPSYGSETTNKNNHNGNVLSQQHLSKTNTRDTNAIKSRKQIKTEETNMLSKDRNGIHQQSETLPICRNTSKGHTQTEHSPDLDCRVIINNTNKTIQPASQNNNNYNSISSIDKYHQQMNISKNPHNLINNNSNNTFKDQKGSQQQHSKANTNEHHPISQSNQNQVYQPYISITNQQSFEKVREFLHQKKHVKAASSLQYSTSQIKQSTNNNDSNNYYVNEKQMLSVVQQQQQQVEQQQQQQQQQQGQFVSSQSSSVQQQYFPKQIR